MTIASLQICAIRAVRHIDENDTEEKDGPSLFHEYEQSRKTLLFNNAAFKMIMMFL